MRQELSKLGKQQNKLYDLLEQEIYDAETFLERMKSLNEKRAVLEEELTACEKQAQQDRRSPEQSIMAIQYVLDHFGESDPAEKNRLLHSIIQRIHYQKTEKGCYRKPDTNLELHIEFY